MVIIFILSLWKAGLMWSIAHVSCLSAATTMVWYGGIAQNMRETKYTIWLYVIIFILLMVSYDQSEHSNKTSDLDPETEEEFYFYHPQCNCYRYECKIIV